MSSFYIVMAKKVTKRRNFQIRMRYYFFCPKLVKEGYKPLRWWTRRDDLFFSYVTMINFYINFVKKGDKKKFSNTYTFNRFFYPKLFRQADKYLWRLTRRKFLRKKTDDSIINVTFFLSMVILTLCIWFVLVLPQNEFCFIIIVIRCFLKIYIFCFWEDSFFVSFFLNLGLCYIFQLINCVILDTFPCK